MNTACPLASPSLKSLCHTAEVWIWHKFVLGHYEHIGSQKTLIYGCRVMF